MINIMVFAGTTEGRELCEKYEDKDIKIDVYTATEYGGELLPKCDNITVHTGRLNVEQIEAEIKNLKPCLVIDATHPYATEISQNIKSVSGDKYIRLLREEAPKVKAMYVDSIEKAIAVVNRSRGNVLITTGSKDLESFTQVKDYKKRCVIRMLPEKENVEKVLELGFSQDNIITDLGPFSTKKNIDHIKQFKIKYLISKESGKEGGFTEKYYACQNENVAMIVIKRPQEEGYKSDEVYNFINSAMSKKQISIIGIGLGNPDTMTIEAYKAIQSSEFIIGAKRMIDSVDIENKAVCYEYQAEKIKEEIDKSRYNKIAVLYSGDVCIHSGAISLSNILNDKYDVKIIQGISSVTYLASKLGISWANSKVVSLHGKDDDICKIIRENKSVFVLTSGNISEICQRLLDDGLNDIHICIGERLSYDDERIAVGYPKDFLDTEFDTISIMYIENISAGIVIDIGIDDDKFIRGSVPMTKSEVRTLVLTELGLKPDSVVYDIGAGTGSVSIECARIASRGKVYSIESNENAVDLISRNVEKFGVNNIDIIHGYAADIIGNLPVADSAFIGGSKGQLDDIVRLLVEKNVKTIVMTAIAIESANKMLELAKLYGFEYSIKQIMVSRGKKVADITLMMAENPIYIIKCVCTR